MSNLIFNVALGRWHFQVTRWPWIPRFVYNHYAPEARWWQFRVFCLFGRHL